MGKRPSHPVTTLSGGTVEEIDVLVVAWPVGDQIAYVDMPGANLRLATKEEVEAAIAPDR